MKCCCCSQKELLLESSEKLFWLMDGGLSANPHERANAELMVMGAIWHARECRVVDCPKCRVFLSRIKQIT